MPEKIGKVDAAVKVPKTWFGVGLFVAAVGIAALVLGPRFNFGWILILLCPLSHFLMMGSHGHGGDGATRGREHGAESHVDRTGGQSREADG